jgi:hypothetical protein
VHLCKHEEEQQPGSAGTSDNYTKSNGSTAHV